MDASFFTLGQTVVDVLFLAAFAVTFRSFWKARPRPMPNLVAWTHVAFAAVALAVGSALLVSGFGYEASYLAALFIAVLGFATAHNWPRTRRGRSATAVGYVTLVVVGVIFLVAIAIAVDGAHQVRNAAARIEGFSRITDADIASFQNESNNQPRSNTRENQADPLAQWRVPIEDWLRHLMKAYAGSDLASRFEAAGLEAISKAKPGSEFAVYRRELSAAREQLVAARGKITDSLWSLSLTLVFVAVVGVSLARTTEHLTRKSEDLRRRDRRPALVVGLVSLAGFFVAISFEADARTYVFWRALSVAVGTGLLATAALVYRRLVQPRGHGAIERDSQDRPPTTPTTP